MYGENSSSGATIALLERMKTELPGVWDQAEVVGNWVWLEFNVPPINEVRVKLKNLASIGMLRVNAGSIRVAFTGTALLLTHEAGIP